MASYKQKMWVYSLCIHNFKENKNFKKLYMWGEVISGKGSYELATCLLKWIREEHAVKVIVKLGVFSSNDGGHTKNVSVVLNYHSVA